MNTLCVPCGVAWTAVRLPDHLGARRSVRITRERQYGPGFSKDGARIAQGSTGWRPRRPRHGRRCAACPLRTESGCEPGTAEERPPPAKKADRGKGHSRSHVARSHRRRRGGHRSRCFSPPLTQAPRSSRTVSPRAYSPEIRCPETPASGRAAKRHRHAKTTPKEPDVCNSRQLRRKIACVAL